jgi:hypothetical protein
VAAWIAQIVGAALVQAVDPFLCIFHPLEQMPGLSKDTGQRIRSATFHGAHPIEGTLARDSTAVFTLTRMLTENDNLDYVVL